jgi:hypothetical protein
MLAKLLVTALLVAPFTFAQQPTPAKVEQNLPTPTPGLDEEGQRINFTFLKEGVVVKEAVLYGKKYTVRGVANCLALYNDQGHVILMVSVNGDEIAFALAENPKDPFEGNFAEETTVFMDGVLYHLVLVVDAQGRRVAAVYDQKMRIIFAVGDPAMAIIPRPEYAEIQDAITTAVEALGGITPKELDEEPTL